MEYDTFPSKAESPHHARSRIPLKGKLPILRKERDRFSRFCPAPCVLTLFYKILIFPSTSSRI
ncbi:hypothetical protein DORFOR_00828 [Dorea formicigenerans ATCC 27755]|uniref:Uncharacterized protein n=1 Tax=Dorea formicigenerans ATCC 27755 TaxID=411461 RepID=B0G3K3_9FIRM|nr:hypothetical protein DORFOR_00828 [Dorea formicigenerans ATCC 27755]